MTRARYLQLLAYVRELAESGIPMDLDLIPESDLVISPPKLLITPEEPGLTNAVCPLRNGLVAYVFGLTIVNGLPGTTWIFGYELELPWEDERLHWLPCRADDGSRDGFYRFPGESCLEFRRENVLNHRIYRQGRLAHGNFLQGYLLGLGWKRVPRQFTHGDLVRAKLSVVDSIGRTSSAAVDLMVDRTMENARRKSRADVAPRRRSLFTELSDEVEVEPAEQLDRVHAPWKFVSAPREEETDEHGERSERCER